jgi:hypothetical protein
MPQPKLNIPKQDTRPPVPRSFELPAHIAARLDRVAADGGHDPNWIIAYILDDALPPEETLPTKKAEQPSKDAKTMHLTKGGAASTAA